MSGHEDLLTAYREFQRARSRWQAQAREFQKIHLDAKDDGLPWYAHVTEAGLMELSDRVTKLEKLLTDGI